LNLRVARDNDHRMRVLTRTLAALSCLAAGAYLIAGRPRLLRWGASDEEVTGPYPGADLVPSGNRAATMAVTIEAPPERVWPWLAQMGYDRAGWYSWDGLDNGGRPSADRIHPEWQEIKLGDRVVAWSPGGPVNAWEVAALEPGHFLGLRGLTDLRGRQLDSARPRPHAYTEGLWGFLLERLPGDRTRLIVSGYQSTRPRWLQAVFDFLIYPPVHWTMQTRQLANLRRLAEREPALQAPTGTQAVPARWRQGLFAGVDYSARSRYRPPPPLYRRMQKRLGPFLISLGIGPKQVVVLEVPGRRTGMIRRNALVMVSHSGNDYLVALAGESEWARNVRAADGQVLIGRRQRRAVRLVEMPPAERPPILRAYLLRWGRQPNSPAVQHEARLYFGVSGDPSVEELATVAEFYPVFRITTIGARE
jgi:F420H(2)-dependent quinone reductase